MSKIHVDFTLAALCVGLLAGCGKGPGNGDGALSAETISGTVLGSNGVAVSGAQVFIDGQSATTTSDGTFSIAKVKRPYDLLAVVSGNTPVVSSYNGLTTTAPLITINTQPMPLSAVLSGDLSGGAGFPSNTDTYAVVAGGPNVVNPVAYQGGTSVAGVYNVTVEWSGPNNEGATVYALQYETAESGLPAAYGGLGNTAAQLQSSGAVSGKDVQLSSIDTGTISGTISVPANYSLASGLLSFIPGPGALFQFDQISNFSTSFSLTVPDVTGGSYIYAVTAAASTGEQSTASQTFSSAHQSGASLTLHAAPTLSNPAKNMTGVSTSTTFSWNDSEHGCIYWLQASSQQSGAPAFSVITSALSATLPNVSATGVQFPASAQYSWQVSCLAPFTSVDAAAGGAGPSGAPEIDQSASWLFAAQ